MVHLHPSWIPCAVARLEHGRYLAEHGAGEVWNWEGAAGKRRWARRVKMLTAHQSEGMEVLELGCGTGYFTKELAKTGANITAIEISPELLELARENDDEWEQIDDKGVAKPG